MGGAEVVARPMFPLVWFDKIDLADANALLLAWNHKMGAVERPNNYAVCHALVYSDRPVGVTVASTLIRPNAGGGLGHLTRENTVELSRLCAERPGLCRIVLRMWREFVFPQLGFATALSYQDADLHNGNTYRFDGWARSPLLSNSGTDTRSGRHGRRKWLWVYPAAAVQDAGVSDVPKNGLK